MTPGMEYGQLTMGRRKSLLDSVFLALMLSAGFAGAEEIIRSDLPPSAQVETALDNYLPVLNAASGLKLEQANQRRLADGAYEFNLRAGSAHRDIGNTGVRMKEWDVALERPLRLFNKGGIDRELGIAGVERAEYALGDAHHEAGRLLLRLWFSWQREQAQAALWQHQVEILDQQARMTEKRYQAGDAPKLESNQARAAVAQAGVSWRQAQLRAQLAGNDLARAFPAIRLPESLQPAQPEAIDHDLEFWKSRVLADNYELGMVQAQNQVQQLLAQRSRADQIPDPTVGMRYSSEMSGNEKVTGIYLIVPIPGEHRSAMTEVVAQQAAMTADQAAFVKRRLEADVYAAYTQAVRNFETWQQAHDAALSIVSNADLVAKAYALGEVSLSDSLTARRLALESSIAETLAQLDANEARYRLLLDAHQLWAPEHDGH